MSSAPRVVGGDHRDGAGRRRSRMPWRRPGFLWLMVAALIVMPLAEIGIILAVGREIGGWPTFALLLVESMLGAWLMKREGRTAWRALVEALHTGRMPARELTDGALVLVGGVLLLTPGFLTDVAGFFAIAPPTRPIARRLLQQTVTRRLLAGVGGTWAPGGGAAGRATVSDDVIQGDIVDDGR